jgi:3-oxoadipate enol-lactonase
MDITPFRVPSSSGADLSCIKFGEGPPLLLAHPLVFSKAYFAAGAAVFGAKYSCVAYDQRGHGDTTASTVSQASMADDVGAILDAMKWDKAAIGGPSLGALSTLLFALRSPAGFGPGSFRDPSKSSRIAASFEDGDLDDAAKQITLGMSEPRAKAWSEALSNDWKNYEPKALSNKLAWILRNSSSWRITGRWPDELQKLTMPVRVFAVQGDPVHPWDTAQTMARTIKGARLSPRVQSLSADAIATQWVDALAS